MTTWNEHETDKCWEEVKSILMGELVIGVPMTFVSRETWVRACTPWNQFPSSGSDAESNVDQNAFRWHILDTKIMPRIKSDRCDTVER